MRRLICVMTLTVIAAITLSACGSDPYCDKVEQNESTLNSFGNTKSDKAYAKYAKTLKGIAKVAPEDVKSDWQDLADVTSDVLEAQRDAGIKLEDTKDKKKLAKLSPDQLEELNKAYTAFNDTGDQRAAVVKNVKQQCEITLK